MDSPDMQRVSLYLPRKLVQEADRTKEKCGFSSRNAFYAKAVESFIAEQLLEDDVINSALTDKLAWAVHALSEDNARAISKGLFRYAVQLEILMRMFAQVSEFSGDELKEMRREAVNNVRRTRGKIPLEELMRGYYNEE